MSQKVIMTAIADKGLGCGHDDDSCKKDPV